MDHRVALPGGLDDLGELLPGGQQVSGLPERQFQHQRPERLLEAAHLVGGRRPGRVGQPYRVQAADPAEGVALVLLGMAETVQGDDRVAGAARPAAQGHLLGHGPGREEGGGLRAEQGGGPLLQGLDDAVAVHVGGLVEVVQLLGPVEQGDALAQGRDEAGAGEYAPRAAEGGHAPLPAAPVALLRRLVLAGGASGSAGAARSSCSAVSLMQGSCRADRAPGTRFPHTFRHARVVCAPAPHGNPQPVDNGTPPGPIALT